MGQTLAQLLDVPTKEEVLENLLYALQGVSFTKKVGIGSGSVRAIGVAPADYPLVLVKITTAGALGVAAFAVATDAVNYGAPITVPANGTYVLPIGVTLLFTAGPTGSGTSYEVGDIFSFTLSVPTFPTAAWQAGSTPLTLLELYSEGIEDLATAQAGIAAGGLLRTSTGPWLDLLLPSLYALERRQPTTTVGNIILTDAANSGPHTIVAGQLWVGTPGGLRFNNVTGGVLSSGGTLTLSWRAESPGSVYNVGAGTITVLLTALAGVTVSNPNPLGGSWITTSGSDKETDAEARLRAENRWPSLGIGTPKDAYDLWAKTAQPTVTRTYVRASPTIPGQIDVFLASAAGTVSAGVVSSVQAYVDPRAALTSVPVVVSASAHAYTISGTVYVTAGYSAQAAADISQNLVALNGGGLNTIGELLAGVPIDGGSLYLSQIVEQIQLGRGVRNVVLTLPAADVAFAGGEVGVLTQSLTIVEV